MTKTEAIAHLEKCFKHDAKFKKAWQDYIEIIVTDELEILGITGDLSKKARNRIGARVMQLFDSDWWNAQL